MRVLRYAGFVCIAIAAVASSGSLAAADGGAYIDLDRTHYLPGQIAHAETYVTVPAKHRSLLDRGPFYAFLVTGRVWPDEGRPLPNDVIRVGTFEVEHDDGETFELTASLSIPDVPGDFYNLAVCNDPCTVRGFREPITGFISIVQTEREATLLDERQRLESKVRRLDVQLRRSEHDLTDLQRRYDAHEADRVRLEGEMRRLRAQLSGARADGEGGALPGGWPIGAGGAALAVGMGVALARARRTAHAAARTEPSERTRASVR